MEEKKEEGCSLNAVETPVTHRPLIGTRAKRMPKGFRRKSVGFRTSSRSYDMIETSARDEGLCIAEYARCCIKVFVLSGRVNIESDESIDRMQKILNRNTSFLEVIWNVIKHRRH